MQRINNVKLPSYGDVAPHDLRRTCAKLCHVNGGELEQIQFLLGHAFVLTTERYLRVAHVLTCTPPSDIERKPHPLNADFGRRPGKPDYHHGRVTAFAVR